MNPEKAIRQIRGKELEKMFLEDMKRAFERYYREDLSRRIRKGLEAKRKNNEQSK